MGDAIASEMFYHTDDGVQEKPIAARKDIIIKYMKGALNKAEAKKILDTYAYGYYSPKWPDEFKTEFDDVLNAKS